MSTEPTPIHPDDPYYQTPLNQSADANRFSPRYAAPSKGTNGLAVASLVLGIVWAFWIGSALAIIFGHTALGQIKAKGQEGKGLAIAGLVLGYVGAATFALFVALPLLLAALGASTE